MADRIFILLLSTLAFEVNSQLCGCGPSPVYPAPVIPQLAPTLPCMGPTIVQQPLIAESCMAPPFIPPPIQPIAPLPFVPPILPSPIQQIAPLPYASPLITPYPNVIAATVVDNTVSNSLANAIQLLIVSNLIENTLNAGLLTENVVSLCDTIISPRICDGYVTEVVPVAQNIVPSCLCESPIIETVGPICENIPIYPNYVQEFQPIFGPAVPTMAPVAAEVLFPSAIPAQLTCNFGYMNTNVPCVSVNVEPLSSFDSFCPNFYNNGYLY